MIMKIDNISSYFKTFIQVNLQHVISLNGSIESGMNSSERYAFCPVDNVQFPPLLCPEASKYQSTSTRNCHTLLQFHDSPIPQSPSMCSPHLIRMHHCYTKPIIGDFVTADVYCYNMFPPLKGHFQSRQ